MGVIKMDTKALARRLRRNMTDAEQRLWTRLPYRQILGNKFRRQSPIGGYIVDFVCLERKLVVEVDGGQHAETIEEDIVRTQRLERLGFNVLRFWIHEVLRETDAVVLRICEALVDGDRPHPNLPPEGEGD